MIDPAYDPWEILETLNRNQAVLNENQAKLTNNMQQLIHKVYDQEKTIETILAALDSSNKANELLLKSLVTDIHSKLNSSEEPK
jgi:hypothetical protein